MEGCSNIVIRPQNLAIRPRDAKPIPGTTHVAGMVEHIEFLGGVVRHRVAVGRHFLLADAPHQRGEEAMPEGTKVNLYLNTDQIIGLTN